MKNFRLYALAVAVPLVAFSAYQGFFVLPHRPTVPDPAHGYIYLVGTDGGPNHYVSNQDAFNIFVPFLCAFVLVWCAGDWPRKDEA